MTLVNPTDPDQIPNTTEAIHLIPVIEEDPLQLCEPDALTGQPPPADCAVDMIQGAFAWIKYTQGVVVVEGEDSRTVNHLTVEPRLNYLTREKPYYLRFEAVHNQYSTSLESHLFAITVHACVVADFTEADQDEPAFVE